MPAPLRSRKPGSVRARLADALSGAAAGLRQAARAGHRLRQRRAHRPPPDRTGLRDHGRGHVLPLLAGAQAAFPDHRWIAADMRRMPLNETFHGLIAWHSLFHLRPEEQRPLFATFARLAAPGAPLMFTSGTTLGKRSGNSKDSRCITAAWTARSIATCWKPTGLKWCDMSSGMRSAAARMSGWPGVAAPSMARRVSRASRQSRAGSVAVDEVLRIPDEPGKIQPFSLAGLDGQAPVRGSRCIVRALRGGDGRLR